ncbi:hypothetical protein Kpho02_41010 [Kitasatospora phosalacinea]|uniref:Uncharacterized protein n=1 Tax=Kitasatospora phosalacinea TaxID=2065 RepID=A0A9W6QC10_9ACTN|nr:hypothetical protein [Kitasatospora phosalacinea]GLW71802.1 hypothetical protein Kpho02_41010 [Kitasatospora phosalacinea]
MLAAQVLGLGLGAADARAADTGHPPQPPGRALGTFVRPGGEARSGGESRSGGEARSGGESRSGGDEGGLLNGTVGGAAAALDGLDPADPADPVGGAAATGTRPVQNLGATLGHHLGTGELPLPGHHADRPDAFSLAAGLLSAVPAQPRPGDPPRASRSDSGDGREPGAPAPVATVPAQRAPVASPAAAPADAPPADTVLPSPAPAPVRAGSSLPPIPFGSPRPRPAVPRPAPDRLTLTGAPTRSPGEDAFAVLVPIAAGLLLTAAAMYKHRGLPGGGH